MTRPGSRQMRRYGSLPALALLLGACAIDFGASVPCTTNGDCPVDQRCDVAFQRCVDDDLASDARDGAGEDVPDVAPSDVTPSDATPGDTSSTDVTPGDTSPSDVTPGDTSPSDATPGDTSPSDIVDDDASDISVDDAGEDTTCVPSTEVCDGADNDCDGAVDEDGVCDGCGAHAVEVVRDGAAPYCVDAYEASRPDATAVSAGVDGSRAVSQPGVLPWAGVTFEQASAACEASGRRLCSATEWVEACQGVGATLYPYGNGYDGLACNGVNTPPLGSASATGGFAGCVSSDGSFDQSGNVSEWVSDQSVRGGAFEDPQLNLQCRSRRIPASSSGPSATIGFRCCADR